MLRLNLASEPEWLDLGHGVRVRVLPCTSGVMAAARGNAAVEALVAAGASEAELALALAKAMAGIAILDWEGVGDAEGIPIPVSPEAASALMDIWPLFEAFQARYVAKGLLLDQDPLSILSEAYRSFRSALLLSQAGGPPHTMLVTSAGRGDGKTTTLVNTAIVFSQLGIRVLVIDADLRRPNCHMLLRTENKAGLSDILAGQLDVDEAIRTTPADNLFLITAGALPPNPAELLGSKRMHELLEELRHRFEFIFIDSSPVLAVVYRNRAGPGECNGVAACKAGRSSCE